MCNSGGEGEYVDSICKETEFAKLTDLVEKAKTAAESGIAKPSIRSQVLAKLKSALDLANYEAGDKGRPKVGKNSKKSSVSMSNVLNGKRKRKSVSFSDPNADTLPNLSTAARLSSSTRSSVSTPLNKRKGMVGRTKIGEGDVVSVPAMLFDGDEPGSFPNENPDRCFGVVESVSKNGVVSVRWSDGDVYDVKLKDCKKEKHKVTLASIIVMLIEGEQVAFKSIDEETNPKNFFELLVKTNWREWVEAVKNELEGWEYNNAVALVSIDDVPANAKVIPLGELYTRKRDGRYKCRQYLMGNLLREGVDFADTFSTTVSGSNICTFNSLATTCQKEEWDWDAVCSYLQCKEQY